MASISLGLGALLAGGLGAAGSVASGAIGANAATTAAGEQEAATEQGIAEQQREFNIEQQNAAPFVSAGQSSITNLMTELNGGTFGPGSLPSAPQYTGQPFALPTLEQAEQTPGYQFALQQGDKGIQEASAATGGAFSGGTVKALEGYNQNLATTTYQQQVQNALAVHNTALQDYQAQLAGYGSTLAGQAQEFGQAVVPAQIGSGSTAALNTTTAGTASSIASLLASLGASQSAGTVGAANAATAGITGATNSIGQNLLLSQLLSNPSALQNQAYSQLQFTPPAGSAAGDYYAGG